jgi:hypothetical protein
MKKTLLWAVLVIATCLLLGCSNGSTESGDTDEVVRYLSTDGTNIYTLEITENSSRAYRAYVPKTGDTYVLTVTDSAGGELYTSSGSVTSNDNGSLKLAHKDAKPDDDPFTVTITTGVITKIGETGETIPIDNGDPKTPPGDVTSASIIWPNQQLYDGDGAINADGNLHHEFNGRKVLSDIPVTNGKFTMILPTTPPDSELVNLKETLETYGITIHNETVKIASYGDLHADSQIGNEDHWRYSTDTASMDIWYVTEAVTIKGLGDYGNGDMWDLDVALSKGSNILITTYEGTTQIQRIGTVNSQFKWQ